MELRRARSFSVIKVVNFYKGFRSVSDVRGVRNYDEGSFTGGSRKVTAGFVATLVTVVAVAAVYAMCVVIQVVEVPTVVTVLTLATVVKVVAAVPAATLVRVLTKLW